MSRLDELDRLHMTGHEDDVVENCQVCGESCTTHDNDGNCVHDLYKVDRDVMQAESREER